MKNKRIILSILVASMLIACIPTFANNLMKTVQVIETVYPIRIGNHSIPKGLYIEDKIYVPLEDVAKALNTTIQWDNDNRALKIDTPGLVTYTDTPKVVDIKDLEVIECEFYRRDIHIGKEKFFRYDGEYYMLADRVNYIAGVNPTYDRYGNLIKLFISRTGSGVNWFDYYFDYKTFSYENKCRVGWTYYTKDVKTPIFLDKKDYPQLEAMLGPGRSRDWFVPISYIIRMMGGTFTIELNKTYEVREYNEYVKVTNNVATIDFPWEPAIDPGDKGRH